MIVNKVNVVTLVALSGKAVVRTALNQDWPPFVTWVTLGHGQEASFRFCFVSGTTRKRRLAMFP